MDIKKKTKIIEVEYWDCGKEDHCHKSKIAAERCVERQPKGNKKHKLLSKEFCIEMHRRKEAGENIAQIARELGKSGSAIHRAASKGERILRYESRTGNPWPQPDQKT